ncbi:MAG: hypothetical protein PVH21_04700 [Myxococcales bacterium]|jgi:hypothetical protein
MSEKGADVMRDVLKWVALCMGILTASAVAIGCSTTCVYGYYGGVCYNYGYYYDSLVSGLSYESSGEAGVQTGVTGEDAEGGPGSFRFIDGDTVSFSLGDTVLGESDAKDRITPFDLAGLDEEAIGGCDVSSSLPDGDRAFRVVANLAALLQSLDTDGDPANGIDISSDVSVLFDGVDIDLSQTWEEFQANADLQAVLEEANNRQLFPDTRTLHDRIDALRALYQGIDLCP